MSDRFEDARGVIQDLLGAVDGVTEIFTRKDAIRGNHVHQLTVQWTYIVSGRLWMVQQKDFGPAPLIQGSIATPGMLVCEQAGFPHAWRAEEDTLVLVFTRGPRSGEAYESDTRRLEVPLL